VARASTAPVLSRRALNRTLLGRQHLLERVRRPPEALLEHLVGLQAQEPPDPYVGLWSRIEAFDPASLSAAIESRRAVRIGLMRTTLHLVTTEDALALAPLAADVHRRTFRSTGFARALEGIDLEAVAAEARTVLEAAPTTPSELGRRLATRWPGRDRTALAAAARYRLPLVQVPPRGLWGRTSRTTNTTLEAWTDRRPAAAPVGSVIRRYLRAFGPASVADMRIWSWMTGLREVVEGLRPELRTFRDEAGRELLDLPDGLLVEPDVPAPVRFLPQYDNVFLSHDDRSRILGDGVALRDLVWRGGILVDGFVAAAWRVRRQRDRAEMTIVPAMPIDARQRVELEAEGGRLLDLLAADIGTRDLRITAVGEGRA
jgi:hypothetical protein